MIFSRGKAKSFDYTSTLRQVEADTIRRWRNIANGVSEPEQTVVDHPSSTPSKDAGSFSLGVEAFDMRKRGEPAISLVDEVVMPDCPGDVHETGMWTHGQQPSFSAPGFTAPGFTTPTYSTETFALDEEEEEAELAASDASIGRSPQQSEIMLEPEMEEEEADEPAPPVRKVLPCDLTLPAEEDLRRRFGTNIRSALGPGTVIEGTFSFDAPVCIDGTLTGEVRSSSALIVGSHATVNATVMVGSLIILGKVTGPIQAEELVEIRAGGTLEGNILTKRLVVEDGGFFNGRCHQIA